MFDIKKFLKQVGLTLLICVPLSILFKKNFLFVFFIVEAIILTNFYLFKAKKSIRSEEHAVKTLNDDQYLNEPER